MFILFFDHSTKYVFMCASPEVILCFCLVMAAFSIHKTLWWQAFLWSKFLFFPYFLSFPHFSFTQILMSLCLSLCNERQKIYSVFPNERQKIYKVFPLCLIHGTKMISKWPIPDPTLFGDGVSSKEESLVSYQSLLYAISILFLFLLSYMFSQLPSFPPTSPPLLYSPMVITTVY